MRLSPSHVALFVLMSSIIHANPAFGQASSGQPKPTMILAANPLGLLQFGPTGEIERLATPTVGLAAGVRIPSLGLLTHVIDDEIGFAWTVMGSVRFYLNSDVAPRGWWVAPRAEWGRAASGSTTYSVKGGAGEIGHRWIRPSGFAISTGAMAGAFKSESGLEGKFVMGVVSLGKAR